MTDLYSCDACGKPTPKNKLTHLDATWAYPEGSFCAACLGHEEEEDEE